VSVDLSALAVHLTAETGALVGLLEGCDEAAWSTPTPSPGWSIADQVSHLAFFDDAAITSVREPASFVASRAEALDLGTSFCDVVAERYRSMAGAALLSWWRTSRRSMVEAMLEAGPSMRVPWYGPDLSVASAITGRIMETWAHGQDVYDAMAMPHPVTDALYDVARLCARTRANSFLTHGLEVPPGDVEVVLAAPDGSTWRFGDPAAEAVRGDAVEFCLVATQRRNLADTSLVAEGDSAAAWLVIAQAFAGPPGSGRDRHVGSTR
jgi:uncharacterized protein (TIGR03084 family)